jgi:hypothetical protein
MYDKFLEEVVRQVTQQSQPRGRCAHARARSLSLAPRTPRTHATPAYATWVCRLLGRIRAQYAALFARLPGFVEELDVALQWQTRLSGRLTREVQKLEDDLRLLRGELHTVQGAVARHARTRTCVLEGARLTWNLGSAIACVRHDR